MVEENIGVPQKVKAVKHINFLRKANKIGEFGCYIGSAIILVGIGGLMLIAMASGDNATGGLIITVFSAFLFFGCGRLFRLAAKNVIKKKWRIYQTILHFPFALTVIPGIPLYFYILWILWLSNDTKELFE